jgi:hypothetical protein
VAVHISPWDVQAGFQRRSLEKKMLKRNALSRAIACSTAMLVGFATCGESSPNDVFGAVHEKDIQWTAFSDFAPAVRLGVVAGDPKKPGPYVVRVKVPEGIKLMSHTHLEERIYTVISGIFYIGLGTTFDESGLVAFPSGSVIVLPAHTAHFYWAKSGEYVTQVSGYGPLDIE